MKRIAVLTSGGDCPGMNNVLQRLVETFPDYEILGFKRGYEGLLNLDWEYLTPERVRGIEHMGGTVLKSSRCQRMYTSEGVAKAVKNLQALQVEQLIVIGGDGSFTGAQKIQAQGIPVLGIPGTIDGDIVDTDTTLGYATAVSTGRMVCRLIEDTARSHDRIFLVEIMGRHCGNLAEGIGTQGNYLAIITPENREQRTPREWEELIRSRWQAQLGFLVLITEHQTELRDHLQVVLTQAGYDVRVNVLGHLQRGGAAGPEDAKLAESFVSAVSRERGRSGKLVVVGTVGRSLIKLRPFQEEAHESTK